MWTVLKALLPSLAGRALSMLGSWQLPLAIALAGAIGIAVQQYRVVSADNARLEAEAAVAELAQRLATQNAAVAALEAEAARRQGQAHQAAQARLEAGRQAVQAAPGAQTPEEANLWLDTLLQR